MSKFDLLAFDADDTLWHNERLYFNAQSRFVELLAHYHDPDWIRERLYQTETRNLQHFGYGIKAFALSMLESAVELTEGRLSGQDVKTLIDLAKEMLSAEVELLPHVSEVIHQLAEMYPLMVITKGDLLDQETKIQRSGLGGYFKQVEVVSHKTRETYARLLEKHALPAEKRGTSPPERFLMVGNSIRSDILPILELGGTAIHIPYETTWLHEMAEPPTGQSGFYALESMGQLPDLLKKLEQR